MLHRLSWSTIKLGIAILPAGLVTFRSATYVVACLNSISSPGIPVELSIPTEGGELKFRAKSYSFDPRAQALHLANASISTPNGIEIATCDDAIASYELDGLSPKKVVVRVQTLRANVTRNADGKLELQKYLPTKKSEGGEVGFDVSIKTTIISFDDRAVSPHGIQNVRVNGLRAVGAGDQWVAHAKTEINDVGSIGVRIVHEKSKAMAIEADLNGRELAKAFGRYQSSPGMPTELKELSSAHFTVAMPVSAIVSRDGKVALRGKVEASAEQFRYRDIALPFVSIKGDITESGFVGEYRGISNFTSVSGKGSVTFGPKLRIDATTDARLSDFKDLPDSVRKSIPSNLNVQGGTATGRFWWDDDGAHWTGDVLAPRVGVDHDFATDVRAHVTVEPKLISASLDRANFLGDHLTGVANFGVADKSIDATVKSESGPLRAVLKRFGVPNLDGRWNIAAHITNRIDAPTVKFTAQGDLRWDNRKAAKVDFGRFVVGGNYDHGALKFTQAFASGPNGLLNVQGSIDKEQRLHLVAQARAVPLGVAVEGVAGTAEAKFDIGGTTSKPSVAGIVEVLGIERGEFSIPALRANVAASRDRLVVSDLKIIRNSASLDGSLSYEFGTKKLGGQLIARNIRLGEFVTGDTFGAIEIPNLVLGGTPDHVIATAQLEGTGLVVHGLRADRVRGTVALDGTALSLLDGSIDGAEGNIGLTANYDTATQAGQFTANGKALNLARIAPELTESITVEGTAFFQASGEIHLNRLTHAMMSASVRNVLLNSVLLGNGSVDVETDGQIISGSAEIGQIERYVRASNVRYDLETNGMAADIEALDLSFAKVVRAADRYMTESSADLRKTLSEIEAGMNVAAHVERFGDNGNIGLDVSLLEAKAVQFRGHNVGSLKAKGSRLGSMWNVSNFVLTGPIARVELNGSVREHGPVAITGELDNLDLASLKQFDPSFAELVGKVEQFAFVAEGTTDAPDLTASATATGLLAKAGEPADAALRLNLDEIKVMHNTGISVDGRYFYRGFTGNVTGSSPLTYPFESDDDTPISATVTLAPRDFTEVATSLPGLDPKRTSGIVFGALTIGGTVGDPEISGTARLANGTIAGKPRVAAIGFAGVESALKDVDASLIVGKSGLKLTTSASLTQGGKFSAEASIDSANTLAGTRDLVAGRIEDLLSLDVSGKVSIKQARVRQTLAKDNVTPIELAAAARTYVTSPGSFDGIVNGDITISGPVSGPKLSGDIDVNSVTMVVPTIQPARTTKEVRKIDPVFDLTAHLTGSNRLTTSTSELKLRGTGSLRGSATEPIANAELIVVQGTFKLPGGSVRLDPDGTVRFAYNGSEQDAVAHLNVDLDGHTAVTIARTQDQIERYDIFLAIRGDVLGDVPLSLEPRSDPADLSPDEILRYLGRTDILTSLSTGSLHGEAERKIKDAISGFAIPSVFDSFSKQIAEAVGLEYLSLEYNSYDQASIAFGKVLGKGLSFQGSRQLSQPPPGFTQRYDLRFVYRPRWRSNKFDRFRISFGADELRPWKLSFEYSFKFGSNGKARPPLLIDGPRPKELKEPVRSGSNGN